MKIVIILLALAGAGLLWMRHDNSNLRVSFERANRVAGTQKTTIIMLKISSTLPQSSRSA